MFLTIFLNEGTPLIRFGHNKYLSFEIIYQASSDIINKTNGLISVENVIT